MDSLKDTNILKEAKIADSILLNDSAFCNTTHTLPCTGLSDIVFSNKKYYWDNTLQNEILKLNLSRKLNKSQD